MRLIPYENYLPIITIELVQHEYLVPYALMFEK